MSNIKRLRGRRGAGSRAAGWERITDAFWIRHLPRKQGALSITRGDRTWETPDPNRWYWQAFLYSGGEAYRAKGAVTLLDAARERAEAALLDLRTRAKEDAALSRRLRALQRRPPKPHLVWIKIPPNPAEVRAAFTTAAAAEKRAEGLRKKYRRGTEFGRVEVWVESPGSLNAKLRRMADEYGHDY